MASTKASPALASKLDAGLRRELPGHGVRGADRLGGGVPGGGREAAQRGFEIVRVERVDQGPDDGDAERARHHPGDGVHRRGDAGLGGGHGAHHGLRRGRHHPAHGEGEEEHPRQQCGEAGLAGSTGASW